MFLSVTLRLLQGFGLTCLIFLITLACAIPLGLVVMFGSMSRFKPLKMADARLCMGHPRHAAAFAGHHRLLRPRPSVRLELS